MAPTDDETLDELATEVAQRLSPGQYGDRVVLTRRQLVGAATGLLGAGALTSLGVDPATAQAAGQIGTDANPVDVIAYDLDVRNGMASNLPMNGNDIQNAGSLSIDSGVIDGSKGIPGVPSSSSNPVLSFDSWRQAASSRPAMIFVQTACVTDGSTDARITLSVDESGGTAPDYFPNIARAPSELGDGGRIDDLTAYMLPAGAQYRVDNTGDPRGQNTLDQVFEFVL